MSTGPEPKEQNTNPAEQPGTPETVTYPALGTRYSMQSHVWANIYVEDETVKCRTCNEQGFVTLRGDLNINPTKYPCPVCLGNVNVLQGKLTPKKARVIAITLLRDGRIIYEIAGVYEKFTGRYQESDLYKSREDAEAVLAISKETTRIFSVADMQSGRRPLPKNMEPQTHAKPKIQLIGGGEVEPMEEIIDDPLKEVVGRC